VQDQKQRHGERGNVADDPGERSQSQGLDEVGDSQNLPEDEAFAMRGVGQLESRERSKEGDTQLGTAIDVAKAL